MEGFRFGPGRKLGYGVDLPQQSADDLARVVTLTESVDLLHRTRERTFGLGDGAVRKILALLFETMMMFQKFLPEELREAFEKKIQQWKTKGNSQ